MEAASVKTNPEAEIRALIDEWADALRAKDVDGIMARHAPDLVSFDCHSALQFKGRDAYRKFLEVCFPCMQGPLVFEIHELDIAAGEDVAFAHFIARCVATGLDGAEHASRLRATVGLRKTNGAWRIAHGQPLRAVRPGERPSDARSRARGRRAGRRRSLGWHSFCDYHPNP